MAAARVDRVRVALGLAVEGQRVARSNVHRLQVVDEEPVFAVGGRRRRTGRRGAAVDARLAAQVDVARVAERRAARDAGGVAELERVDVGVAEDPREVEAGQRHVRRVRRGGRARRLRQRQGGRGRGRDQVVAVEAVRAGDVDAHPVGEAVGEEAARRPRDRRAVERERAGAGERARRDVATQGRRRAVAAVAVRVVAVDVDRPAGRDLAVRGRRDVVADA